MATLYRVRLTNADVLSEFVKDENGAEKETVRKIELGALESLFHVASSAAKTIKNLNLAMDMVEQVKALSDDKDSILLSNEDLTLLNEAIEATAKSRPRGWYAARQMFKSIEAREEVKPEEVKAS